MQTNKIDKHIADKFKERELKPSASAWERLNVQLDNEQQNKKKNRILYFGYVASIAMLIGFVFFYQGSNDNENIIEQILVETSLDTMKIKDVDFKDIIHDKEVIIAKTANVEIENNETVKKVKKHPFKNKRENNNNVVASATKKFC